MRQAGELRWRCLVLSVAESSFPNQSAVLNEPRRISTKINFWCPETAGWGKGFHAKGWWSASLFPPSKVSGNSQLTFPVLFSKFWDLRTSSSQPNFQLRFLSRGCASMNDVCKLRSRVFKTTNGQEQNYAYIRPNYKKVLDCSWSHISKLRIRVS